MVVITEWGRSIAEELVAASGHRWVQSGVREAPVAQGVGNAGSACPVSPSCLRADCSWWSEVTHWRSDGGTVGGCRRGGGEGSPQPQRRSGTAGAPFGANPASTPFFPTLISLVESALATVSATPFLMDSFETSTSPPRKYSSNSPPSNECTCAVFSQDPTTSYPATVSPRKDKEKARYAEKLKLPAPRSMQALEKDLNLVLKVRRPRILTRALLT